MMQMSGGEAERGREDGRGSEGLDEGTHGVEQCAAAASLACEISLASLSGASREPDILNARSLAVCIARDQEEPPSYPEIGRYLGGRDHSTVIASERRGRQLLDKDEEFRNRYIEARRHLHDGIFVPSRFVELPDEERTRELIKGAIHRLEISPVDTLDDQAVQGMKLIELVAALPESASEAPEALNAGERARLIMISAGILPGRRVRFMSPVERDSLQHVLDTLGLLRKQ